MVFFSLQRAQYSLHKALLQYEEDDQGGQGGKTDPQHDHAVIQYVTGLQIGHEDGHGNLLRLLQYHQGPHVGIPAVHESDGGCGGIGGLHDRHEHACKDLEFTKAVDAGGLRKFQRKGVRALPEQKDEESGGQHGEHVAGYRIDQPDLAEKPEQGNQRCGGRNHHGKKQQAHDKVLALILIYNETVPGHGADEQRAEGGGKGIQAGIGEGPKKRSRFGKGFDVFQKVRSRQHPPQDHIGRHIGGGNRHPVKGEGGQQGHDYQKQVLEGPAGAYLVCGAFYRHLDSPTFNCTNASSATKRNIT